MAAGTVGVLNVKLKASTRGFSAGMKRAGKTVRGFTGGVRNATRGLKTLGIGLAGALSVRALIGVTRDAVRLGDEIAKTSTKLGIGAEALQEFQYGAARSGIAARTFNMGLQRMARRMAEAATGTGEAKAAIAELGLDAKKMQKLGTEESLYAIARAFEKVANPMTRLRLAFKLFDSEGVAMVNLLNQGESGMRAMARRANELGIVVSRIDLAGLESISDAWTGVGMALKGLSMRTVAGNAPLFSLLGNLTADIIGAINRNGPEAGKFTALEGGLLTLAAASDLAQKRLSQAIVANLPPAMSAAIVGVLGLKGGGYDATVAELYRDSAIQAKVDRLASDANKAESAMAAKGKARIGGNLRSARELGLIPGVKMTAPAEVKKAKLDEERNKKLDVVVGLLRGLNQRGLR